MVFVAGETGGDIGNRLSAPGKRAIFCESANFVGVVREKLSNGAGSGGDIRLLN